jgi:hypothetical protein
LNYLSPFSLDIKPPIMLIFLALLAAEQCAAVKLAADPLSRASQRRQISLPASPPAETGGTEIVCQSYTMSVVRPYFGNMCRLQRRQLTIHVLSFSTGLSVGFSGSGLSQTPKSKQCAVGLD